MSRTATDREAKCNFRSKYSIIIHFDLISLPETIAIITKIWISLEKQRMNNIQHVLLQLLQSWVSVNVITPITVRVWLFLWRHDGKRWILSFWPFCHGARKLDIFTLFTTFFLWTSLQFIIFLCTVNSTVMDHRQFRVTVRRTFFFPEWYSISIHVFWLSSHNSLSISCFKFDVGCRNLINWIRDQETLNCTASRESESTRKLFTCHC